MQYWRQIENFALSHVPPEWFVDLLEGLRDTAPQLGPIIDGDMKLRDTFHFHRVIWTNAKVTIRRSDLDWLPADIRNNEAEFPLHQLSLVKGHFRVIGWPDDDKIFHIALIDPHHNIHKTKNYTVGQYCHEQLGAHHQMLEAINELGEHLRSNKNCGLAQCGVYERLAALKDAYSLKGQIYIDPDIIEEAVVLISQGKAKSVVDIFTTGVITHGH